MARDFKRMNFFDGYFTRAEDWEAGEEYRNNKHQLHNKALHGYGIVRGYQDELGVQLENDGTAICVGKGLAIDKDGHELLVSVPQRVQFLPLDVQNDGTVYLKMRYGEQIIDFREDGANPDCSGHAFIEELVHIELSEELGEDIELARLQLSGNPGRVQMPKDPKHPTTNEVDLTHRQYLEVARHMQENVQFVQAQVVEKAGETTVGAKTRDFVDLEGNSSAEHRFYLVSCYPKGDTEVYWQIGAKREKGKVQYRLEFDNNTDEDVTVEYCVYRLLFDWEGHGS